MKIFKFLIICLIVYWIFVTILWVALTFPYFNGRKSSSFLQENHNQLQEGLSQTSVFEGEQLNNYSNILKVKPAELNAFYRAVGQSVRFLNLKRNLIINVAEAQCRFWNYPLIYNCPHNLEYFLFQSLTQDNIQWIISEDEHDSLLVIPQIYPYTISYCWKQGRRQENWAIESMYLREVASEIVMSEEWRENYGINFLVTLTHPKSTLGNDEYPDSNELKQHAMLLRSDYDFYGYSEKDIIVPYYIDPKPLEGILRQPPQRKYLLFFVGSNHPSNGIRRQISYCFERLKDPDLYFKLSFSFSKDKYFSLMRSSEFCLILRGDTASSARFFESIALNCIPVIISDHVIFPFQSIINYSKFTILFPESVIHNISFLISYLKTIDSTQKHQYHQSINQVQSLLLYQLPFNQYSSYNPITLLIIEALIKLTKYCQQSPIKSSKLCSNLERRLQTAKY